MDDSLTDLEIAPPAEASADPRPAGNSRDRRARALRLATIVGVVVIVALGAFLRIWALGRDPINSDEAVVGLMAHEILRGHFFAFYWGQNYGGGEPYLVAVVFAIFGQSSFTLGLTPVLLAGACALLVVLLGRRLFSLRIGVAAALVFWVGSETYIWQSTLEYGFRWVALFCGLVIAILALRLGDPTSTHRQLAWSAAGLFAGIGWWSTPEIAYYLVPSVLVLGYRIARRRVPLEPRGLLCGVLAFVVGAMPWLWANVRSGLSSLHPGTTPDPRFLSHLKALVEHAVPMVLGLQLWSPGNDLLAPGRWIFGTHPGQLIGLVIALACVFWLAVLALSARASLLVWFMVVFPVVYSLSPFNYYWLDGRYALYLPPMAALLIVAAADNLGAIVRARRFARVQLLPIVVVLALVLSLTGWALDNRSPYTADHVKGSAAASLTSWSSNPDNYVVTLAAHLEAIGETRIYAGYWVSYVLDLESHGAVVASDARYARYAPYLDEVEKDPHPGWLFVLPHRRSNAAVIFTSALLDPGCAAGNDRCLDSRELELYLGRSHIGYRSFPEGDFVLVQPDKAVAPYSVFRYFHIVSSVAVH